MLAKSLARLRPSTQTCKTKKTQDLIAVNAPLTEPQVAQAWATVESLPGATARQPTLRARQSTMRHVVAGMIEPACVDQPAVPPASPTSVAASPVHSTASADTETHTVALENGNDAIYSMRNLPVTPPAPVPLEVPLS